MPRIAPCCKDMDRISVGACPPIWVDHEGVIHIYIGQYTMIPNNCPFCGRKIGIYY